MQIVQVFFLQDFQDLALNQDFARNQDQDLDQNQNQDLTSLARKLLARFEYFLQHGIYA